jgi:hypothetical protein
LAYPFNKSLEAVKDADLVSESVPENVEIKISFYQELAKVEKRLFSLLILPRPCLVIMQLIQVVLKSFSVALC